MQTQVEMILQYMKEFGSINPLQALADIGCFRLAARIADIKDLGVPINSEMVESVNRYGKTVRFAKYSIDKTRPMGKPKVKPKKRRVVRNV